MAPRHGRAGRPPRRRGRELKKLLILGLLVIVLLAGDVAARAYAEARTQQEVNRQSGSDLHVTVQIHSFPFVGRLLFTGEVSRVDAQADDVQEGPISLHALRLELRGVKVDRNKTISHQRVYLDSIGGGSASAVITAGALSDALHTHVDIVDGAVEVEPVAGHTVRAGVAVKGGTLSLNVAGVTLPAISIPITGLLPCHPDAKVQGNQVVLSCSFSRIPDRLVHLVNGIAVGGALPS